MEAHGPFVQLEPFAKNIQTTTDQVEATGRDDAIGRSRQQQATAQFRIQTTAAHENPPWRIDADVQAKPRPAVATCRGIRARVGTGQTGLATGRHNICWRADEIDLWNITDAGHTG